MRLFFGQEDLSSLQNHPLFNFASNTSTFYGLNVATSLSHFEDLFKNGIYPNVIQTLRHCVGDKAVLNVIEDIATTKNLNDSNNPKLASSEVVPDDDRFFTGGIDSVSQVNPGLRSIRDMLWGKIPDPSGTGMMNRNYQGRGPSKETAELYLFGNHHAIDRINRFWTVFMRRFLWGDSVQHAILVAKKDLKVFDYAGLIWHMADYIIYYPNELLGGFYNSTDPSVITPDIQALTTSLQACLENLYISTYRNSDPIEFNADVHGKIPFVSNLPSVSSSDMLDSSGKMGSSQSMITLIGVGMLITGILLFLRKS